MLRGPRPKSFIVRVHHGPQKPRFSVHNLKTGEVRQFANWQELRHYLEQRPQHRLR